MHLSNFETDPYLLPVLHTGPLQGRLVDRRTEASVAQFSLRDLRTGAIAYEHSSDSTAVSDMMVLQVSDDFSILNTIININVRAEVRALYHYLVYAY